MDTLIRYIVFDEIYTGWEKLQFDIAKSMSKLSSSAKNSKYIDFKNNPNAQVRLIGKPYAYWIYWARSKSGRQVGVMTNDPGQDRFGLENPQIKAIQRWGINAIDRADGGIKILNASKSLISSISTLAKTIGADPGDEKNGFDIRIKKTQVGNFPNYIASFLYNSPLTKKEQKSASILSYDLSQEFKPTTYKKAMAQVLS